VNDPAFEGAGGVFYIPSLQLIDYQIIKFSYI